MCPPESPSSPARLLSCFFVKMFISSKGRSLGRLKWNFGLLASGSEVTGTATVVPHISFSNIWRA